MHKASLTEKTDMTWLKPSRTCNFFNCGSDMSKYIIYGSCQKLAFHFFRRLEKEHVDPRDSLLLTQNTGTKQTFEKMNVLKFICLYEYSKSTCDFALRAYRCDLINQIILP